MKEDNFEVTYEYVPSEQSDIRLQRGFEIIFKDNQVKEKRKTKKIMIKFLVSTKTFANNIQTAIDNQTLTFDINEKENYVNFHGKESIFGQCERTASYINHSYRGKFNPEKWHKMLLFIKQLPEQPIVIELEEYMHTVVHEEPEITLSQFVMNF